MADNTGAERSTAANTPKGQAGEELLSAQEAAECLLSMENIAILCHQYPDGEDVYKRQILPCKKSDKGYGESFRQENQAM